MDTLDMPSESQPATNQLESQVSSLRNVLVSTLVLTIIMSGTLNLFLLRQVKYARADLNAVRPQVMQVVADYQKGNGQAMDDFIRKIAEYGRTHADFTPIMTKYGINPTQPAAPAVTAPAAVPAAIPAAVPAPAAKKK